MKDLVIWTTLQSNLEKGIESLLFVVVSHSGSSPGKTGFKMVVAQGSKQVGTIGGGIMELNILKNADSQLPDSTFQPTLIDQIHNTRVSEDKQSGLICAGEQAIAIYKIQPKDRQTISNIHAAHLERKDMFVTYSHEGLTISNEMKSFHRDEAEWSFTEQTGFPHTVYIFGAGHVGTAISRVLSTLDFYTILNDNREDLTLFEQNSWVDEKRIGDYYELGGSIIPGSKTYAVVVTYGYPFDVASLQGILKHDLAYIGLMGSSTKIKKIKTELSDSGVSQEKIDSIYAPIGIRIDNGTPQENCNFSCG